MHEAVAPERQRVRHAVFITTVVPKPADDAAHGVFQRMRLMLEAIDAVSDRLQVVFLGGSGALGHESAAAQPGPRLDPQAALEHRLVRQWGLHAEVLWVPSDVTPTRPGWAGLRALLSLHAQDPYRRFHGTLVRETLYDLLQARPDLVFAHRLPAMSALRQSGARLDRVIMDLDDIEHVKAVRLLRQGPWWWGKAALWLQIPALMLGEVRAIRSTAATLVCSEGDRRYLGRVGADPHPVVIPNAVETGVDETGARSPGQADVLFVGAYTYGPNVHAASHLIRDIWPRIRSARPDARLLIVGGHPENVPEYADPPAGVIFTGFVDDLAPLYASARVVCCPIRAAGGTRIKIIEAAVHGRAIVSTRMGAEGLAFVDGEDILLRDSLQDLAQACLELLSDEVRASQLGQRARERAMTLYARRQILERLKTVLTH